MTGFTDGGARATTRTGRPLACVVVNPSKPRATAAVRSLLERELREEISLSVRLGAEIAPPAGLAVAAPVSAADSPFPGDDAPAWPALHGYRMRVWLAEPADPAHGPRRGTSHEQLRWAGLGEVGALPWLDADLPVLASILAATRT